jgi:hypothetical protein
MHRVVLKIWLYQLFKTQPICLFCELGDAFKGGPELRRTILQPIGTSTLAAWQDSRHHEVNIAAMHGQNED